MNWFSSLSPFGVVENRHWNTHRAAQNLKATINSRATERERESTHKKAKSIPDKLRINRLLSMRLRSIRFIRTRKNKWEREQSMEKNLDKAKIPKTIETDKKQDNFCGSCNCVYRTLFAQLTVNLVIYCCLSNTHHHMILSIYPIYFFSLFFSAFAFWLSFYVSYCFRWLCECECVAF